MAVSTTDTDGNVHNVHFDTIADSVLDFASCARSTSKEEHYGKLIGTNDRFNGYSDLTNLKLNNSMTFVPRLPPRTELHNASNNVLQNPLEYTKNISSVLSKDIPKRQYIGKVASDEQLARQNEKPEEQLDSQYENPDEHLDSQHVNSLGSCHDTLISSQVFNKTQQRGIHLEPSSAMKNDHCDYLHPV